MRQDNGLDLLPIPENYYGGQEARYGPDRGRIERLRALNILYDEDGAGAYYRLNMADFADRFFVEVVPRDADEGFGAANAPVRIAAQSRLPGPNDGDVH